MNLRSEVELIVSIQKRGDAFREIANEIAEAEASVRRGESALQLLRRTAQTTEGAIEQAKGGFGRFEQALQRHIQAIDLARAGTRRLRSEQRALVKSGDASEKEIEELTQKIAAAERQEQELISSTRSVIASYQQLQRATGETERDFGDLTKKLESYERRLLTVSDAEKAASRSLLGNKQAVDVARASYNELQAELRETRKRYNDLSAAERNTASGREMVRHLSEIDEELKRIDRTMGQHQRNVGNYGSVFDNAGLKSVRNALSGVAAAWLSIEGARRAYQAVSDGADLQLQEEQFERLTASINSSADVLLGRLRDATSGLVSDAALIASASQIISLGLADSEDGVVRLANAAARLNLDMQQLTLTLANDSTARLDSLGLSVEGVTTRQRELEETGLAKGDAFDLAVIEALEERMDLLGDASETTAGQLQIAESQVQNFFDALKRGAADGASGGIQAVAAGLNQSTEELTENTEEASRSLTSGFANALYLAADAANNYRVGIRYTTDQIQSIIEATRDGAASVFGFAEAQNVVGEAASDAAQEAAAADTILSRYTQTQLDSGDIASSTAARYTDLTSALYENEEAAARVAQIMGNDLVAKFVAAREEGLSVRDALASIGLSAQSIDGLTEIVFESNATEEERRAKALEETLRGMPAEIRSQVIVDYQSNLGDSPEEITASLTSAARLLEDALRPASGGGGSRGPSAALVEARELLEDERELLEADQANLNETRELLEDERGLLQRAQGALRNVQETERELAGAVRDAERDLLDARSDLQAANQEVADLLAESAQLDIDRLRDLHNEVDRQVGLFLDQVQRIDEAKSALADAIASGADDSRIAELEQDVRDAEAATNDYAAVLRDTVSAEGGSIEQRLALAVATGQLTEAEAQLILQRTIGIKATEAIAEAFLQGKLSAEEAAAAVKEVQQAVAEGRDIELPEVVNFDGIDTATSLYKDKQAEIAAAKEAAEERVRDANDRVLQSEKDLAAQQLLLTNAQRETARVEAEVVAQKERLAAAELAVAEAQKDVAARQERIRDAQKEVNAAQEAGQGSAGGLRQSYEDLGRTIDEMAVKKELANAKTAEEIQAAVDLAVELGLVTKERGEQIAAEQKALIASAELLEMEGYATAAADDKREALRLLSGMHVTSAETALNLASVLGEDLFNAFTDARNRGLSTRDAFEEVKRKAAESGTVIDEEYIAILLGIPDEVGTRLEADADDAIAKAKELEDLLDRLDGRTAQAMVELGQNGPSIGDDTPIPNFAGTDHFRGGLSWVGERGPELVNLPHGSQIFNNATSQRIEAALGRNKPTIIISPIFQNTFYGEARETAELATAQMLDDIVAALQAEVRR